MKRVLLFCLLSGLSFVGKTQIIRSAHFHLLANTHQVRLVKIVVGDVEFKISSSGEIISFDYLPGGDITYYDGFGTFDREGKIKSIGGVPVNYYDRFDWEEKFGKLKSFGNLKIEYFDRFGEDSKKGKLKSIGNIQFDYNGPFDDADQFGKLKQVGNYLIRYYTKFDASELLGKVKSVGPVHIEYLSGFNTRYGRGIKSIQGNSRKLYVSVW